MKGIRFIGILLLVILGCNDHPAGDSSVRQATDELCAPGSAVEVIEGRSYCVYRYPIVIETGFRCPAFKPQLFTHAPDFGVCTDFGPLNDIEIQFTLDQLGVPGDPWVFDTEPIDLLFVIDNSGGMCQKHAQFEASFPEFADKLRDVDFQIGITTTHVNANYALEPIAKPGAIQSTPQPILGSDRRCLSDLDDSGEVTGTFENLRVHLQRVVSCMSEPDERLLSLTDQDFTCLNSGLPDCGVPTFCDSDCSWERVMPESEAFRVVPTVLRSADYRDEAGNLDLAALNSDFSCASLVGTRGYGIEKGLGAAVLAVSRELTGGAIGLDSVDLQPDRPNHGLIRRDAKFGVVFLTDENDCTHDGSIDETTSCGDAVCSYSQVDGSNALVSVELLREQLLGNLSDTKERTMTDADVFVGSIHGTPSLYSGTPELDCQTAGGDVMPTCQSSNGRTFSGDRYQDFVGTFSGAKFPSDDIGFACEVGEWTFMSSLGALLRESLD